MRSVDATQFERRRIAFDFDMMDYHWEQSLSPGNEQSFYWGSAAADQQGSRNYMGVKSKAIDAMIAAMLNARTREDFVAAVRALDRVLLSGFYVVPLYHLPEQWVARWTRIEHPAAHLAVRLSAGNLVAGGTRNHDARRTAHRRRSTTCSAAPACARRSRWRCSTRPTARA